MYVVPLKTMLTDALRLVFDSAFHVPQFQNLNISIEYPVNKQDYPSIWVNYDDSRDLVRAGISHIERDSSGKPFTRWEYQGEVTFTPLAFTSLECDSLFDELVRLIAFSPQDGNTQRFRSFIEADNDLIACNVSFDSIRPGPLSPTYGTPWSTDEILYERSVVLQARGEFVTDPQSGTLIKLSAIDYTASDSLGGGFSGVVNTTQDPFLLSPAPPSFPLP